MMYPDINEYFGLTFIGAALAFPRFKRQLRNKRVLANGITTSGVIVGLRYVGENENYAMIQFATTEGTWITGEYNERTTIGYVNQSVTVVYNARKPKEFIVTTDIFYNKYSALDFTLLIGILFFTIGVIGIINYYR